MTQIMISSKGTFSKYLTSKHISAHFESFSKAELDNVLSRCYVELRNEKGEILLIRFECSRMPTTVLHNSSVQNLQTSSVQNFQNKSFPIQFPVISNFSNFTINYNIVPN
jgi:hypothetical protein